MLDSLDAHHDAILAMASNLDALVAAPRPDTAQLAQTRLKMAKLSNARTKLLETIIYPTILPHLTGDEAAAVRRLRDERLQRVARSAEHVGAWPPQRVEAEWVEYQRVFAALLRDLRARIAAEKAILTPGIATVRRLGLASVLGVERLLRQERDAGKIAPRARAG